MPGAPQPGTGIEQSALPDFLAMIASGIRNVATDRRAMLPALGATLGSFLAPGAGTIGGAVAGGLGAGAGEMGNVAIDAITGQPQEGTPLSRVGQQAMFGVVTEVPGRMIGGLMERGAAPFGQTANREALSTADELRDAMQARGSKWGFPWNPPKSAAVFPNEVNRGVTIDLMNRLALASNKGREIMRAANDERRKVLIDGLYTDLTAQLGRTLDREQFGRLFADEIQGNFDLARSPAKAMYQSLEDQTGGTLQQVPVTGTGVAGKAVSGTTLKRVGGADIDYDHLRGKLQDVMSLYENSQFTSGNPGLDTWFRKLKSDGASKNYIDAKADRDVLRRRLRDAMLGPEDIWTKIAGPKTGTPTYGAERIEKIKAALTNPETKELSPVFGDLQRYYVRQGLSDFIRHDGQLDAKALDRWLQGELKERMPSVLFNKPETINALKSLSRQASFLESGGKSATIPALTLSSAPDGGLSLTMNALASPGIGRRAAAAAITKIPLVSRYGSQVAATLFTNPTTAKLLAEGFRLPANTKPAISVIARLMAEAKTAEGLADYRNRLRENLMGAYQGAQSYVQSAL